MATELFRLSNGDDCTVSFSMVDIDGVPIAINEAIDFEIQYYTTSQFVYTASRVDGVLSDNCSIEGEDIVVYIDRFNWYKLGRAYIKISLSWVDEHFPDGKKTVSNEPCYSQIKVV